MTSATLLILLNPLRGHYCFTLYIPATMIRDGLLETAEELGLRPLQRGLDEDPHDRVDHPEVPLLLHVPAKLRVDHPLKSKFKCLSSNNGKWNPKLVQLQTFQGKKVNLCCTARVTVLPNVQNRRLLKKTRAACQK